MKTILYIGKYNGIVGGIERYMQKSAELLRRHGLEVHYLYTENGGKALIHSKFPIGIANESFLESEHSFGHLFSKEIHIVRTEDFNKELWFIDLKKLKDIAPEIKWIAGPDAVDSSSFSALDFVYAVNN